MNIIQLQVMLHHFYDPKPYPSDSPAVRDAHAFCVAAELLEPNTLCVTERGRVFVNALKSVPLPVQAWVQPKPDERHG